MAFFLIVPSVITVSILLVHALAKRLGLRIYYTTLVAAAVLSFMAIFAATLWSPAVGKGFLLRLGLIISAVSLLLTQANRFLIKQQQIEEKNFQEEVKAAYEAEVNKEPPPVPVKEFSWEENPPPKYNESVESGNVTLHPVDAPDNSTAQTSSPRSEVQSAEETQPAEETSPSAETSEPVVETVEPVTEAKPAEKFPLEKVFEPLPEVKHEVVEKPPAPLPKPEDKIPLDEVFEPLHEVEPEKVEPPAPKPEDKFPLDEVFRPLSTIKLDKLDTLPAEEPTPANEDESDDENIDTLDDILDKAYNERAKGHVWQTIELYKKALERYRNDEYAPFVAIDLGNIYKEQALYSKAIKIYEEALTLPAVARNRSVKKEFVNNLEYLRIVRDVLLKYQALSVPYGKLSGKLLQEIDDEFRKMQRRI